MAKNVFNKIRNILRYNFIWSFDSWPNSVWKEAKDVFKKPVLNVLFSKIKNGESYPCYYGGDYGKFLTISEVYVKTKYGMFRFEELGHITFQLFGYRLAFIFDAPIDDRYIYFETLFDYVYTYNKDLNKLKENFAWQKKDENGNWVSAWNEDILK